MGKKPRAKLYLLLVAWTLLAVGAVTAILAVLGSEAIGREVESNEAVSTFIYFTVAGDAALLLVLPFILWGATRGLNAEYERLLSLYRSGQSIRSTLDIADMLGQIARDAALFSEASIGLATLVEDETDDLILKASYLGQTGGISQHHRRVEEWYLRRCAVTGELVREREPRFSLRSVLGVEHVPDFPAHILSVPVPGRERSIGIVTVVRPQELGDFSAADVQMVEEMAAQVAMAVEQAVLFAKVRSYADEVEMSYDSTLKVLMAALDTKDAVTQGHSERVARLTVTVAREMGITGGQLVDIERGALLHDVGKIGVPDDVLRKEAALTEEEWEAMQKHPLLAGLMVSKVGFLEKAMPIMLYHHERFDGSGYPFGLEGEAIPLEARIFAAVDAYDAMTSDRPYRKAMPPEDALRDIQRNSGIQFDPQVVTAFTRVIARMQPLQPERDRAA
jgi:GAF domain-containing protein